MVTELLKERINPGIGVGVIVLNSDGEILLGQRMSNPGRGLWSLPGGKVDPKESVIEAGIREVAEEAGISVKIEKFISTGYEKFYGLEYLTFGLITRSDEKPKATEPDAIGDWQYFPFSRLPGPLFGPSERIIRNYVKGVMRSEEPLG